MSLLRFARGTVATLGCFWALSGCGADSASRLSGEGDESGDANPSAQRALTMARCGTELGSWDGTAAYSNGKWTGTGTACDGAWEYGLKYQCAELVMRHVKTKWGFRWWGNANALLANAPADKVDVYFNDNPEHPPVPGDALVWQTGDFGHVGLVTEVRADALVVLEQNIKAESPFVTLPYSRGLVGERPDFGWAAKGWAHVKDNPAVAPVESCAPASPALRCQGRHLSRCQGGAREYRACSAGCVSLPEHAEDLCAERVNDWYCGRSNYRGEQLWTCRNGALYKCEGGQAKKVVCPHGCVTRKLGEPDSCAP